MADKDHKKWSDLVSFGTPVQREDVRDSFDFKASEPTDETAYELSDILISSYQTGGSGSDDMDVAPEPEPVSDFTMTDHFDFF
ncbi:hypothetical protein XM53_00425 [Roseovarius atlanticus]|uniref:Uncharacterized protein n=1 Tax=Roseovarius atlanticus TaxID=1641875 RepID=A0A0T5NZG7_9RHOB|nr:hypothetical protein [Roseovarius atlanticus]KRS14241.1 hypothetical protein XM53_00425 [Roseovarius atlanticus]